MLWGANANVVKNAANSPVKRMVSISECLNYFLYMKAG
ncbi:putative acetyltransferase protein [Escherichia coli 6-175-07_S3_C3]|nr:putative acetyltransferase protein [Escherichia coli 6-175-07_S3_C3]KEM35034.1 putative acetyltransferase protein [Escherichia coli 6-319-05_S3_C2]